MVIKDCTVTVSNNTAKIDEEIYLYKNDKNIELTLNIVNSKYKYTYSELDNLIASTKAAYAQVKFKNGDIEIDFDIQETKSGAVKLLISEELIDEDTELGDYSIQIRLFDSDRNSVITLPPIENCIHIKRPLFDNSNVVFDNSNMINEAKINLATLTTEAPLEVTDSNGNYVKTVWKDKDKITDAKMNKIESGIYQNSAQLNNIANKKIDDITLSNNVLTLLANSKTIKTITLPSTGGSGSNAREIELQKTDTYIQWRYVGDTDWSNLVALNDLKGEKGDKGDTGATPNLQIGTVETLASGSSATASITGTTENPLLNLGIPRGTDGTGTGGSGKTLVIDYTHNSNTVIQPISLDLTTGIYTTENTIEVKDETPVCWAYNDKLDVSPMYLPYEIFSLNNPTTWIKYKIKKISDTTFKLLNTDDTDLVYTSEKNTSVDVSKFHFETASGIQIMFDELELYGDFEIICEGQAISNNYSFDLSNYNTKSINYIWDSNNIFFNGNQNPILIYGTKFNDISKKYRYHEKIIYKCIRKNSLISIDGICVMNYFVNYASNWNSNESIYHNNAYAKQTGDTSIINKINIYNNNFNYLLLNGYNIRIYKI